MLISIAASKAHTMLAMILAEEYNLRTSLFSVRLYNLQKIVTFWNLCFMIVAVALVFC